MRRAATIGAIVAGGVIVILAIVFAGRFGSDPRLVASPLIGTPVTDRPIALLESPGAVQLTDNDGIITVVNFWASWCLPCRQEHEALVAASTNFDGVEFVGVLYQDTPERGIAFLDELGRGTNYVYALDEGSRTALDFGVLGLPETFFIDEDGIIVGKVNGPVNYGLVASTLETMLLGGEVESVSTGDVQQAPTNR